MNVKATELRIGNLVSNGHNTFPIDSHLISDVQDKGTAFEAIQLTPELLMQCGFECVFNTNTSNSFFVFPDTTDFYLEYSRKDNCFDLHISSDCKTVLNKCRIKYLHQLQNIYFSLINEELPLSISALISE